jgi:hypothetical protein
VCVCVCVCVYIYIYIYRERERERERKRDYFILTIRGRELRYLPGLGFVLVEKC